MISVSGSGALEESKGVQDPPGWTGRVFSDGTFCENYQNPNGAMQKLNVKQSQGLW